MHGQIKRSEDQVRYWVGFNCTKCETLVLTENQGWACLCQRCYHGQQPDIERWINEISN